MKHTLVGYEYYCVQERRPASLRRSVAPREKALGNSSCSSLLEPQVLPFPSFLTALSFATLLHLHERLLFPPLRRGPKTSLEMEPGVGDADGSAAHESTLIALSVGSLLSSACPAAVSLLPFFFSALFFSRFLAMTSPTARKRPPPPPRTRNANSASPKSASDLTPRRCDAFNLVFK